VAPQPAWLSLACNARACKAENTRPKQFNTSPLHQMWHPQQQLVKGMAGAGQIHTYIQGMLQGSANAGNGARSMPRGGAQGACVSSSAIGVDSTPEVVRGSPASAPHGCTRHSVQKKQPCLHAYSLTQTSSQTKHTHKVYTHSYVMLKPGQPHDYQDMRCSMQPVRSDTAEAPGQSSKGFLIMRLLFNVGPVHTREHS